MIQTNQKKKSVIETKKFLVLVDLLKKLNYNAKITEIENKIASISGLAITTTLTEVENKIPNVSNLTTKIDYNTKINETENKSHWLWSW